MYLFVDHSYVYMNTYQPQYVQVRPTPCTLCTMSQHTCTYPILFQHRVFSETGSWILRSCHTKYPGIVLIDNVGFTARYVCVWLAVRSNEETPRSDIERVMTMNDHTDWQLHVIVSHNVLAICPQLNSPVLQNAVSGCLWKVICCRVIKGGLVHCCDEFSTLQQAFFVG